MTYASSRSLRRIVETRPGYDCIASPCGKNGCGTIPGASHGRHGDEWVYTLTDGEFAVSLVVFTGRLNGVRLPGGIDHYPVGANLSGHAARPAHEDQIREASAGQECTYLDGGRCFDCWSSVLAATEFVKDHGVSAEQRDQTDRFWCALEDRWRELRQYVESNRPSVKQCPCCEGAGVVALEEVPRA